MPLLKEGNFGPCAEYRARKKERVVFKIDLKKHMTILIGILLIMCWKMKGLGKDGEVG